MNHSLPSVHLTLPRSNLFRLPPESYPLPPYITPQAERPWFRPFNPPQSLYGVTADVRLPLVGAAIYIVVVLTFNHINRKRNYKPWNISKTDTFRSLLLTHNICLTLFSLWVFLGISRALTASISPSGDTPYLVRVADALCNIHGYSRSPNDAPYAVHSEMKVVDSGLPDPQRLWASGQGYFIWVFYMSKFYDAVDTFFLCVKGKKCSLLHLYHHSGVILCAWSGFRYATPPALWGLLFNAGVHTLMYFYYSLATLGVPVSLSLRKLLTGLQIAQFFTVNALTLMYLFISYDIPTGSISADGVRSPAIVSCLETSGQVFPVLLGNLFLIPLSIMFIRFYVNRYIGDRQKKTQ